MIRLVRVILSADVDKFTGGIRNAIGTFSGFASNVATGARSVVSFLGDIGNIVSGVAHGFNMLTGIVRGLWDTFIQGAISEERLGMTMKFMTGSAETAAGIMERLDDWIVKTGTDGDDAEEAILDMAKALRATDGAVDPDKLFNTMNLLKRLSIATGMSMAEMSKIVGRALTGDVEMLARTLGISKEKLAELSPEFAKFMQDAQGAGEAQLGAVTRLGSETAQMAGDALKALDEVANALGATDAALDEYANTTEGKLLSLQGLWENFTEEVGDELLPIIGEALEKIIGFISDHEEDIAKFVDAFGDIAAEGFDKLMEWVDGGGADKLIKSLEDIDKAGYSIKGAFEWLLKAAETIQKAVDALNALYTKTTGGPAPGSFDPLAVNTNAPLLKIINGETPTIGPNPETMPPWMKSIGDWFQNITNPQPQKVEVSVKVDDEGKLIALVDKRTEDKLTEFVDSTTNSKGPKGAN